MSELTEPIKNSFIGYLILYKLSSKKFFGDDRMNSNDRFRYFPGEVHLIHVLDLKRFCVAEMSDLSNPIENPSRDSLKPSKLSSNKILYQDRNTNGGFSELRASENSRPAFEMTVLNDLDSISRLEGFW